MLPEQAASAELSSPANALLAYAPAAEALRLHGRALQRWTELGCPRLALTVTDDGASVVAAAYTGD